MEVTTLYYERCATKLVRMVNDIDQAKAHNQRGETRRCEATYAGACDALSALGLGMTSFAIQIEVREAFMVGQQSYGGPRPAYNATNNGPQRAWDNIVIAELAPRLAAL